MSRYIHHEIQPWSAKNNNAAFALQKASGAISKTEAVEAILRSAIKADELGARVR